MKRSGLKRTGFSSASRARSAKKAREKAREKPGTPLKRSGFKKNRPRPPRHPGRPAPEVGPLTPTEWKRAVFEAAGYCCQVTGHPVSIKWDHAHHVVPARTLKAHGAHAYLFDPRNGMAVSAVAHELHENGSRRIYRSKVPRSVWEFCTELPGPGEWGSVAVERAHPIHPTEGGPDGQ